MQQSQAALQFHTPPPGANSKAWGPLGSPRHRPDPVQCTADCSQCLRLPEAQAHTCCTNALSSHSAGPPGPCLGPTGQHEMTRRSPGRGGPVDKELPPAEAGVGCERSEERWGRRGEREGEEELWRCGRGLRRRKKECRAWKTWEGTGHKTGDWMWHRGRKKEEELGMGGEGNAGAWADHGHFSTEEAGRVVAGISGQGLSLNWRLKIQMQSPQL